MEESSSSGTAHSHNQPTSDDPDLPSLDAMDEPSGDDTADLETYGRQTELASYFKMRKDYPLLEHAEFLRLFEKFKQGSDRAADILTYSNVGLALSYAIRNRDRGVAVADLVQEALIAIRRQALPKFEPERGNKFSTYCIHWVRQAIIRAIQNTQTNSAGRVPVHWQETTRQINKVRSAHYQLTGTWPDVDQTYELLQKSSAVTANSITRKKIEQHLNTSSRAPISLDAPIGDADGHALHERIADISESLEDRYAAEEAMTQLSGRVLHEVGHIPKKEMRVINLRFGLLGDEPKTLQEIGIRFDLTRERIRQIESIALKTLAKRLQVSGETIRDLLEAVGEAQMGRAFLKMDARSHPRFVDYLNAFEILCEHVREDATGVRIVPRPARTLHIRTEVPESWARAVVDGLVEQGWAVWQPQEDALRLIRESTVRAQEVEPKQPGEKTEQSVRTRPRRLPPIALTRAYLLEKLERASVTIRGIRMVRGAIPLLAHISRRSPQEIVDALNALAKKDALSFRDEGRIILLKEVTSPDVTEEAEVNTQKPRPTPTPSQPSRARTAAELRTTLTASLDALARALKGTT